MFLLSIPQDGTILAWKFNSATNTFDPAASLTGHMLPVISLVSEKDRLYSASMDHTIRVSFFIFCKYFYLFTNQENLLFSLFNLEITVLLINIDVFHELAIQEKYILDSDDFILYLTLYDDFIFDIV